MKIKAFPFLILSLLSSLAFASAKDCELVEFSYQEAGKKKISQEKICFFDNPRGDAFYASQTCLDSQCGPLLGTRKAITLKDYPSESGTPSSKLCEELGGVPRYVSYKRKSDTEAVKSAYCLFEKSQFVDMDYLMYRHRDFIINF